MNSMRQRMLDVELNYRKAGDHWAFDVNAYRQQYQNQLVLTGAIDAQGYPIRENVGQSFRQGLELTGAYELTSALSATANVALSQNENVNWVSDPLSSSLWTIRPLLFRLAQWLAHA